MERSQTSQGNRMSTVLGRRLGGELTKHRLAAGLTQGQAAKVISASTGKIARMESGWVPMRDPDIRVLCELYGVSDPAAVGGLLELARVDRERRKAKGWWNDVSVAPAMKEYITLESAATAIKTWQTAFVPGLLQTESYVRALNPDDAFVAARLARQRRLVEDPPLRLRTVVYEAVLRNLVGGAKTMRGQLEHLADTASRPNVSVRVLPFHAGAQLGMGCGFNIISFADPGAMDVVYMEIPRSQTWIEGGLEAAAHDDMFERIAEQALNEHESRAFISNLSKEL
ncbi:helix-turn-helix transcriptional regulator [Streptomyces rimosus]|uniref:helix-turn-helix domain-containing protein n=1 Tax=Streptomyces rimosus TaxID=1927 RepID=UPI00051939DB|nr:helix-turn-helix transcriptional regulator [Streptomyces rimosus]